VLFPYGIKCVPVQSNSQLKWEIIMAHIANTYKMAIVPL